jgi:hypothetical protein
MRTTVNIHDGLLETVKRRAQEEHRTLGDVIEEALRAYLTPSESRTGPPLKVFDGPLGVRPGVDLSTNAGIYDAMYAEEDAEYAQQMRR